MRSSPRATPHLVVDEVQAMGLCGLGGRCMIALLYLEDQMLARLYTSGKARAAQNGASLFSCQYEFSDELVPTAVLFTKTLIRSFLNYARPLHLICTTSVSNADIIGASFSFRLLEDGTTEKGTVRVLTISFTI